MARRNANIDDRGTIDRERGMGRCAFAIAALAFCVGCGAKTGLPVPELSNLEVQGSCACGMCRMWPWCPNAVGGVDCTFDPSLPGSASADACRARCPSSRTLTARDGWDQNGAAARYYCLDDGLALTPAVITNRTAAHAPDPCHYTESAWNAFAGTPGGMGWGPRRADDCASASSETQNGTCGDFTRPELEWGSRLRCPKDAVIGNPSYIVRNGRENDGQRMLASHCNTLTEDRFDDTSRDPGARSALGVGNAVALLCFVDPSTVHTTNTRTPVPGPIHPGMPGDPLRNPPDEDPGAAPNGWTLQIESGSTLAALDGSGNPVAATLRLEGTAAAAPNAAPDDYFVLTDLRAHTTGAVDVDAGTGSGLYTSATVQLLNTWVGTHSWATGEVKIPAANAPMGVTYVRGSGTYYFDPMTPSSDVIGTWTEPVAGGTPRLVFDTRIVDGGYTFIVHLEMTADPRPTAAITAVARAAALPPGFDTTGQFPPPEVPIACTGPEGATFRPTGTVSPTGARARWALWLPGAGSEAASTSPGSVEVGGDGTTFTLPLYPRYSQAQYLSLSAWQGPFEATDSRSVQVVDIEPPLPNLPDLKFACGWGTTRYEPTPNAPTLCHQIVLRATDACDPRPVATFDRLTAYDATGAVVQRVSVADCVRAPTGYLDTALDELSYVLEWHAVDSWRNQSGPWLTRYRIGRATPTSTCGAPRKAIIEFSGSAALARFDFTKLAPGGTTLPADLSFHRASPATVQTGANTVVTGIGNDVARIGQDGAGHVGLVFEEPRTNLVADARDLTASSWRAGLLSMTTPAFAAGPDGSLVAGRSRVPPNGFSNYAALGLLRGRYTASEWIAHGTTGGAYQLFNETNPSTGAVATGSVGLSYRRITASYNFAGRTAYHVPADARDHTAIGGIAAVALDNVTDLHQFEAGAYATEAIVTSGGAVSRAGDLLDHLDGPALVDSGRLSLSLRLQPKGRRGEYPPWGESLWTVDFDNWAAIDPVSGTLWVVINGEWNTAALSPALDWNALDTLEVYLAAGGDQPTVAQYRINGGTARVAAITGAALSSLSVPGPLQLLSYAGGYQFTSYWQSFVFWRSGAGPDWLL